jgi:hypothetical protein
MRRGRERGKAEEKRVDIVELEKEVCAKSRKEKLLRESGWMFGKDYGLESIGIEPE